MSRKRSLMPEAFRQRKKICTAIKPDAANPSWSKNNNDVPNDTKDAIVYLKNLFPVEKFDGRLPPIILKHQLYSIVKNRTVVDKQLNDLRDSGEIRLFKFGLDSDDLSLLFTEDYREHVLSVLTELALSKKVIDKFMNTVIPQCSNLSISRQTLAGYHFRDEEITQLMKAGLLTIKDSGSWWLAVPRMGTFMKSFTRGRKAALLMIRKCKYREILRKELECRKLHKVAKLGISYHIHDIIGADLVECVSTTSGQLLRLVEK